MTSYFKLVFLPVDNDRSDLLVHEEEDGEKQSRDGGKEVNIPRRVGIEQRDCPPTKIRSCRLLQ